MQYHDGTTELVYGPKDWPMAGERAVLIPSDSTPYVFGEFDAQGRYHDAPRWRILAHELCAHSIADAGDGPRGDRQIHDEAIQIENDIASEHGEFLRGKFRDRRQGESGWRRAGGKEVYYKNRPVNRRRPGPSGEYEGYDYVYTLP